MESQISVRESFRQITSNLAKLLKKYWPDLSHLVVEKSRKRTGSGVSSVDGSQNNSPMKFGDMGAEKTVNILQAKARAMSMQDDSSNEIHHQIPTRSRADSYAVQNPIEEID